MIHEVTSIRVWRIQCDQCRQTARTVEALRVDGAYQSLEAEGWDVVGIIDRCPDCVAQDAKPELPTR